ncbi:MAG: hypothetical protein FWG81_07790 [Betaproteobacteria bacterium]|nr:hypothetical protein [Betaproteobacteria bacterium]
MNAGGITFSRSGNDLVIGYGENDRIVAQYHFSNANYRMAQIEFANGKVYQLNDLLAPIPFVTGVVYQLSDFILHEQEPVIDDEEDDSLEEAALYGGTEDDGEDDVLSVVAGDDDLEDEPDGDTIQTGAEDDPLDYGEDDVLSSVAGDDGEGEFSDGIISFTGLNLDEPGATGDGETFQPAGAIPDGLMEELSSGFVEEDYLLDDGDLVDVTLAGVQLPEEAHYGL